MITVSPQVVKLFFSLVQPPQGAQIYSPNIDSWKSALEVPASLGLYVGGLTKSKATQIELDQRGRIVKAIYSANPEFYQILDTYHYSFAAFDFHRNQEPIPVQDKLLQWKVSEYYEDRRAPSHLVGIESMLYATLTGGYFATVVPKHWLGRVMQFRRWLENNCAIVARIALPPDAVKYHDEDDGLPRIKFGIGKREWPEEERQKWSLIVFQRPAVFNEKNRNTVSYKLQLKKSEFRYTPFVFPMESGIEREDIERCMKRWNEHEWFRNSIKPWLKFIEENKNSGHVGTHRTKAIDIKEQQDYYFLNPSEEYQPKIIIVDRRENMKDRLGVQIKIGNRISLTPNTAYGMGALIDFKSQEGMQSKANGTMEFTLDSRLYRQPFSEVRDSLVSTLCGYGLVPYMVEADHHKMKKRERWLSIQLTPTERMVQMNAKSEQDQSLDIKDWETLYADIGMQSTFPEIVDMWYKRAKWMKIDKYLKNFQLRDVVYQAIYQSHLNGNVMGLGKTRATLFTAILRCSTRCLIVCPAKLIDTWQDEIQQTLVPFARMQKVNWQGKPINVGCNIITDIASCSEERLEMFNLVSIDRLKMTPRDGEFYKCPECGSIVFSKHKDAIIHCTGNTAEKDESKRCNNRIQRWREMNRHIPGETDGYWKWTEYLSETGEVISKFGGHRIPKWARQAGIPSERFRFCSNTNERSPRPEIPRMEPQGTMFKKMERYQIGVQIDPVTKEQKPVYKYDERDFHVKWTLTELLRWRFNFVAVDEIHGIANEDSQRTSAVSHLTGKTRLGNTGTPLKGYPRKILPILNWIFKRPVYPDYRPRDPDGKKRFDDKYKLEVNMGGVELADGSTVGGQKKVLPKINNSELFQSELSSLMIRRTRNEPDVASEIKPQKLVRSRIEIDMDEKHKAYYQKWLDEFAEWWAEMKRENEGKNVSAGNILTKLTYLANASFIPHHMLKNIFERAAQVQKKGTPDQRRAAAEGMQWAQRIGKYEGPMTAKMTHAIKMIIDHVKAGDKTIAFAFRQNSLDLGNLVCQKKLKFNSMVVDGRVPIKAKKGENRGQRHRLVEEFRFKPYHVMWAGTAALAEGMNIPEANRCIVLDYDWDDVRIRQAIARTLRLQQQKTVYATNLLHKGAIDSYMAALSYLKSRSADEAIDYMEFDDFTVQLIPDIRQYADAIVDGTEQVIARKMWTAIDFMNQQEDEEGDYGVVD